MSDDNPDISALKRRVESINAAHTRLGHRLGWRFLAGPRRTFASRDPFALVTLYFRFREARAGKDALKRDFNSFEDGNSKGEWTVRLRTEEDVRLLLTHL